MQGEALYMRLISNEQLTFNLYQSIPLYAVRYFEDAPRGTCDPYLTFGNDFGNQCICLC